MTADRYPYLASMTDLDSMVLPDWAVEGGRARELGRLTDPATRRRLADEIRAAHPDPEWFDRIVVASVSPGKPQDVAGRTLRQLGDAAGRDPLEAAFDLIVEHQAQVTSIHFSMSE